MAKMTSDDPLTLKMVLTEPLTISVDLERKKTILPVILLFIVQKPNNFGIRIWSSYKNHKKNEDLNSSNFSRGIFGRSILFLVFKLILVVYWSILWSWRLVDFYILSPAENWEEDKNFTRTREYPDYLTNWGDTIIMLYLLYSTPLAIRIFYLEYRRKTGDIGTATMDFSQNGVKWYYFPAQILFELAAVFALLITILYYGLMGGGDNDILNIHPHVINSKFFGSSLKWIVENWTVEIFSVIG